MVKKEFNKKYQYIAIVGFCTFFGLLLSMFLIISPLYKQSKSLTKQSQEKSENLKNLKAKKAKLIELSQKEEKLKEDAKKVEAALPTKSHVGRLFIQVDEMAKSSNGSVKSVSETSGGAQVTGTTATSENISKVSYTVPIEFKSYFDFKDFILKAESGLRIMDIGEMNISTSDGARFSATMSANTYVRNK